MQGIDFEKKLRKRASFVGKQLLMLALKVLLKAGFKSKIELELIIKISFEIELVLYYLLFESKFASKIEKVTSFRVKALVFQALCYFVLLMQQDSLNTC